MPTPIPEIAPALVPLVDGIRRAVVKLPSKGLKDFPAAVCLEIEGNPGDTAAYFIQDPWRFASGRARAEIERAANLHPTDSANILAATRDWVANARQRIEASLTRPTDDEVIVPYGLYQRVLTQPVNTAQCFAVGTPPEFMAVLLNQPRLPPDTVLGWDKQQTDRLVVLDLDFHKSNAPKPTDSELDTIGYALSPAPWAWWRTQGGGLHAVYAQSKNSVFTAMELGAGAAAQLLVNPTIVRCGGSVELLTRTRHPLALQKGLPCGPVHQAQPDENFECLAAFSRAGATDEEISDVLEESGLALGQRLDHSFCLIEPEHTSTSPNPVVIMDTGVFCHSCMSRTGHGWTSWAEVRRLHGMTSSLPNQAAPIMDAVEYFIPFDHAEYLISALADEIPADYRKPLYSALLKRRHGADPRVKIALQPFKFVRGQSYWLHADNLLTSDKLNHVDVSVLASTRLVTPEGETESIQHELTRHRNTGPLDGWTPIGSEPFIPIYSVHNRVVSPFGEVMCKPKSTKLISEKTVRYLPPHARIPVAAAEQAILDFFPGLSLTYVKALIIAMGCGESGQGKVPILWATGPSGAAKTMTLRIVQEMFGEPSRSLSGVKAEERDLMFGEALERTRAVLFDDFAKDPREYRALHTFLLRISRQHTSRQLYRGAVTHPVRAAIILTDWKMPEFFTNSVQFGRRVHFIQLHRVEQEWDSVLKHHIEDWWWKNGDALKAAAESFYSHLVDDFFPEGDTGDFSTKMEQLGIGTVVREARVGEDHQLTYIVRRLANAICTTKPLSAEDERRIGRGMREVMFSAVNPLSSSCRQLVESLGDVEMNAENLRHALEPYNVELDRYLPLSERAEFHIKENGAHTYIRIVERGCSTFSPSKRINEQLFLALPIPEEDTPVATAEVLQTLPGLIPPSPSMLVPTVAALAPSTSRFFHHPESDSYVEVIPSDWEAFSQSADAGLCVEIDEAEYREVMAPRQTQTAIDQFAAESTDPRQIAPSIPGYQTVFIDYETQSACDLKKYGSYVYAQHPTTKVLCAYIRIGGYRIFWTEERFNIVVPAGVTYLVGRHHLREMIESGPTIIVAHNMNFERPITVYTLGLPEPEGWLDTADLTLMRGLPAGADQAGEYLFGVGKDVDGYKLMMKTCKPNKKGEMPAVTDVVMQRYVPYNARDVDISVGIADRFGLEITPTWEHEANQLHQAINHFGIKIDRKFAETLRSFDEFFKTQAGQHVEQITNGEITRADLGRNDFLKDWFSNKGLTLDNMRADNLEKLIDAFEEGELPHTTERGVPVAMLIDVIKDRMVATRAAMSKVDTALRCAASDGRMHAQFRYWGAHTGRWSGYQFQPQNLKRPDEDFDLKSAIEAVERADLTAFSTLCRHQKTGKPLPPYELLSSLVRGLIVPEQGHVLVVGDFAQIESRNLLWLCEDWENMQEHLDFDAGKGPNVYCTFASSLYGKVIVKKQHPNEYQAGKIGQLACGYQGGEGAINRFAYSLDIDLAAANISAEQIKLAWRAKYQKATVLWKDYQWAAQKALLEPGRTITTGRCEFTKLDGNLLIRLPSGRVLTYLNARLEGSTKARYDDSLVIVYDIAVKGRAVRHETYGGKITENIDQAVCRDLLVSSMLRLAAEGYPIPLHVHDENVAEPEESRADECLKVMKQIMCDPPAWAYRMPTSANPEIMLRYGK